jgi:hypothetical protein
MTTYILSYYVKNAREFEEGSTVIDMGNGWFQVSKTYEGWSKEDGEIHAKSLTFPLGSILHTLSLVPLVQPKPKRKAAWKQNPLARFKPRNKA